jgi:hypothetical protein
MPAGARTRRSAAPDQLQLSLPLFALSEQDVLRELHARGATHLVRVRLKANRSRLISISADRETLNLHECFRTATSDELDAIAVFACALRDSPAYRRAIAHMRAWQDPQNDVHDVDSLEPPCCATPAQRHFLASLYRQLNHAYFAGTLPDLLPIRLSDRMSRRLGQISYAGKERRTVREIALNVDLMLERNEQALVDTLLHEMAHAEAWITQSQRGHGAIWRAIAKRVGCEARACSAMCIRKRRKGTDLTHVPRIEWFGPRHPT